MESNFKCRSCGKEFFEPMYTIEYHSGGLPIYRNSVPFYGKFSSSSPEDKREMLRKRSEIYSKREADKRNYINKRFSKRFGGK
jgi:hypothetical protein